MGKQVFKHAAIGINGTALGPFANEVTTVDEADDVDATGFTEAGYREHAQGLKDCSITINFAQDFAPGSVDAVLSALYASGEAGTVTVKPTSATVSATNPQYTMVGKLFSYAPVSGAVGDLLTVEAQFLHSGTAGITKATA